LELLAANVLAALLMIVLMAVITTLGRDGRAQAASETVRRAEEDAGGVVRMVQWDLANADRWRMDRSTLVLEGHGSLDPRSMEPADLPVVVEYTTVERGGGSWLVRRQRQRAGARQTAAWSEWICPGVEAINVLAIGGETSAPWQSVPARVRLKLSWRQADRNPLEQVVVVR
jgi:hypothetical protein